MVDESSELRKTFMTSSLRFRELCRRGGGKNVTRRRTEEVFLMARHSYCSRKVTAAVNICIIIGHQNSDMDREVASD